jgi:hypothetical protein
MATTTFTCAQLTLFSWDDFVAEQRPKWAARQARLFAAAEARKNAAK